MSMMIPPEEYNRFADLIKRLVVLDVLARALEIDQRGMERLPLKFGRVWKETMAEVMQRVEQERVQCRRQLRRCGGHIVEVRQWSDAREVQARFRGFFYRHWFDNEWLRSECEEWLRSYWREGKNTRQQTPRTRSH
jgi:hypothetical protein